ncbi:protein transport protein SEC31-like [Rhinopithecus roxellana]|uniref:protein transport protein SEC31-like n=1 Tax=Rhinopithecus roxellana TaxID=61622 RepID=UPI0012370B49|nr:protein transport protein SEC31-like [Rhinopithecus roxellana]
MTLASPRPSEELAPASLKTSYHALRPFRKQERQRSLTEPFKRACAWQLSTADPGPRALGRAGTSSRTRGKRAIQPGRSHLQERLREGPARRGQTGFQRMGGSCEPWHLAQGPARLRPSVERWLSMGTRSKVLGGGVQALASADQGRPAAWQARWRELPLVGARALPAAEVRARPGYRCAPAVAPGPGAASARPTRSYPFLATNAARSLTNRWLCVKPRPSSSPLMRWTPSAFAFSGTGREDPQNRLAGSQFPPIANLLPPHPVPTNFVVCLMGGRAPTPPPGACRHPRPSPAGIPSWHGGLFSFFHQIDGQTAQFLSSGPHLRAP